MTRIYCDACSAEITEGNRLPPTSTGGVSTGLKLKMPPLPDGRRIPLTVEVGSGDYCLHCVIDTVNKMDHRPRPA